MNELVAVYGSLRQGMGNHRVISDNEFICQTTLTGNFRMVSLYGYPGLLETEKGGTPIVVEVYRVTTEEAMRRLDALEGYRGPYADNFYDKIKVTLDNGMEVSIYTLEEDRYGNNPPVESGDWVEYRKVS